VITVPKPYGQTDRTDRQADERTDGPTTCNLITALCTALRCKNVGIMKKRKNAFLFKNKKKHAKTFITRTK